MLGFGADFKHVGAGAVVAVVDPVSTGACLARYLADRGHPVVRVWSDAIPPEVKGLVAAGLEVDWEATVDHTGDIAATVESLKKLGVDKYILVGSEPGVNLHADLTTAFGLVPGDEKAVELQAARRNKYLQSETIRAAGLTAVHQALAEEKDQVETFIAGMVASCKKAGIPFKAVVKPVEGAGSDGVSICNTEDEARDAFNKLKGTQNLLGLDNYQVLCQEYLAGDEYVVDTVSRNGEHKVVAIWKYDKRDYHGKPVVYHGMELLNVESDPELNEKLVKYIMGVLGALGITDGAIHSEIMSTKRGPVLVESNCRLHGGEGIWLPIAQASLGYTMVSALYDATFDEAAFAKLPMRPLNPMLAHGAWVTVRSPESGVIASVDEDALATIRGLASFRDEYLAPCLAVGKFVTQTVDATTVHGCFNLSAANKADLKKDYDLAQELINKSLFEFEDADTSHTGRISQVLGFGADFEKSPSSKSPPGRGSMWDETAERDSKIAAGPAA